MVGPRARAVPLDPPGASGLIWLQYVPINLPVGWGRAAHATNALALFAVALAIALQAQRAPASQEARVRLC